MILSTNQPYFFPYPGFFYKAHLADLMVILDTVQFPQGTTWITRNRFKNDQGIIWMTIPVWKKGLGLQRIDKVRICYEGTWMKKHLASFRQAYKNAPYFAEHMSFVSETFSLNHERLIDLNMAIVHYLARQLGVKTKLKLLSELGVEEKGDKLLIQLCKQIGASRYLVHQAAGKYLNGELFQKAGIRLQFFKCPTWIYPQLWGDFLSDLSALDLLFNCGPKAHNIMIDQ
jgi:hypothetical protein